jgi:hypothetical protein
MSKLLYLKLYLILTFLGLGLLAAPVFALSSGGVGGYPAQPDPNIPYSESWFIYSLDLGESKDDAIIIFNTTDQEQILKLYAVDSIPSNQGNFALEAEDAPRDGIGAWLKLSQQFVTLAAGENKEIPFTITIPQNADVGEHSGGIILQKAQASEIQGQTGAAIVTRVGIRVYQTVPGEIKKDIQILEFFLKEARQDQKPYLDITLTAQNQGNVSLKPQLDLVIGGFGKLKYFTRSNFDFKQGLVIDFKDFTDFFTGDTLTKDWQLLRDQKVTTKWTWPKPEFGRFTFQAKLTFLGTDGQPKTLTTKTLVFWVMPWLELAVVGGLILLIILILLVKKLFFGAKSWQPYQVKAGDQLASLAQQAGVSWKRLAKVNKLKTPLIKPGQTILLPPNFINNKVKRKADKKPKV